MRSISVCFVLVVLMQAVSAQKVMMHTVVKGETLYGLSKTFHTSVAELLQLNPGIIDNNLPLGMQLKVPAAPTGVVAAEKKFPENAIIHIVKPKETIYSISKQHSVDQEVLMLWNDLQTIDIKIGQQLIVGYQMKNIIGPLPADTTSSAPVVAPPEDVEIISSVPAGSNLIIQKGIAVWAKEADGGAGLFALHPTLPKGTLIQVTNLMNNKTITLKVIGKLPATMQYENIALKISAAAAKELNVLDEKFLVQISYVQE